MSVFYSIKKLLQHSAVYGIGHIVTRSINFLLLPLYTNVFPREEFGVVGILFTYIAILTIIYTYGLDAAFFRFYILEEEGGDRKEIFSTAFYTILFSSILFTTGLIVASEPLARLLFSTESLQLGIPIPRLIVMSAGILFFDALSFLPFLILRAEQRPIPFVILKFLNVLFNVGGNILFLVILKRGVQGVFFANLCASGLTFLLMLPLIFRHAGAVFSRPLLHDLFQFALPYIPSTLAVVIMDTIDRPLVERLVGLEASGLYNAGVKLGMFMSLFVAAFRFAWHPFFLATSKQENARQVFSRVFTYVILACLGVFLLLSIFLNDLARLSIGGFSLIGRDYWDGLSIVPVVLLAYVFYAAYLNFLIGVYLYKKTKYLPPITLAGMVGNLAANFTLIPLLGIIGAAWARLIAYLIMAISLYRVQCKLYPVDYEWGRLIKLVVVVAVAFFAGQLQAVQSHAVLKIGVVLGAALFLVLIGFFEKSELQRFKTLRLRIRRPKPPSL
ncbi:oligosaccharide flippase family protein [candidate division KSB1 bacterium]|nr:oligosaccharide flippase family protein [candidate division KSB1 bacterium]